MSETARLDGILATSMDGPTRAHVWKSAESILSHGPLGAGAAESTTLALGYVQSGKTTSITALTAAAADQGYQVIVALLGSTNLLLDQNRSRLEAALGIGVRDDYVWVSEVNPANDSAGKRLHEFVERGRRCLVPVLKHAGRISAVGKQLEKLPAGTPVLIIDDEADQASLNTSSDAESRTYAAIKVLRGAVPNHQYVQYTATPYAPLLLDTADILSPQFVEFLTPGKGYTGGKEFFIDGAERVARNVPFLDEQASTSPPLELQHSLAQALSAFLAGSAILLEHEAASPPISMLVHSTARNDVQSRYEFLIRRRVERLREELNESGVVPELIAEERRRLVANGVHDIGDSTFVERLRLVLRETTIWLVNSAADVNKVDWHVAPIHILIGGNKLDRGFTVEGLTVTYMNRPASPQVDTLEQRARAFGYRGDLLPYCQFFASKRTVRSLTEIVHTEEDLRARLRDHVEGGGSVKTWAEEIGLLLPPGMAPTRSSVVRALATQALGWHTLRKPTLRPDDTAYNRKLLQSFGLLDAEFQDHGRVSLRTMRLTRIEPIVDLLQSWRRADYSPGWLHDEFVDALARTFPQVGAATIMLMETDGEARTRSWSDEIGFVNLFQGRDLNYQSGSGLYPGDRNVLDLEAQPNQIVLQVHRAVIRDREDLGETLPLALYLGEGLIVRKDRA